MKNKFLTWSVIGLVAVGTFCRAIAVHAGVGQVEGFTHATSYTVEQAFLPTNSLTPATLVSTGNYSTEEIIVVNTNSVPLLLAPFQSTVWTNPANTSVYTTNYLSVTNAVWLVPANTTLNLNVATNFTSIVTGLPTNSFLNAPLSGNTKYIGNLYGAVIGSAAGTVSNPVSVLRLNQ